MSGAACDPMFWSADDTLAAHDPEHRHIRPRIDWPRVGPQVTCSTRLNDSWRASRMLNCMAVPLGLTVVYLMMMGGAWAKEAPASAEKKTAPCSAAEFHQWDFWLGYWRVTDPKGVFQGVNEIQLAPSGCGLIENWHGAEGGTGISFNGYDAIRRTWTQFWLSPGAVIRLEGHLDPHGTLRMRGTISYNDKGVERPFRGVWTPQKDGSVRQEFFEYDAKTRAWREWFTGIYRRATGTAQLPACATPESRQFDFWVGKWDVFDRATGDRAGSSSIEKLYGGCAIRENWTEPGFEGGSLNVFSAVDKQWHQTWVDQSGTLREFAGGVVDGDMVLIAKEPSQGATGSVLLVRMRFTQNPDRTVRQHSEYSKDEGKTWLERYDYVYRPTVTP